LPVNGLALTTGRRSQLSGCLTTARPASRSTRTRNRRPRSQRQARSLPRAFSSASWPLSSSHGCAYVADPVVDTISALRCPSHLTVGITDPQVVGRAQQPNPSANRTPKRPPRSEIFQLRKWLGARQHCMSCQATADAVQTTPAGPGHSVGPVGELGSSRQHVVVNDALGWCNQKHATADQSGISVQA
jgi:hypothetical protein